MPKNYFKAIAVLIGYIIGVGMFGVPFLVSKSGMYVFLVLIVSLGLMQHFFHLIYANVILVTKDYHRLPGYAGVYLGKNGKRVATFSKLVGNYGALLAYIIITGIFLNDLFSPYFGGNEFIYASLMFTLMAIVLFFGIKMFARVELVMTTILLLVVGLIIIKGGSEIAPTNYTVINWKYFLLPYGAILFAVDGNGAIPIVVKLMRRNQRQVRNIISIGTLTAITVIIAFTIVVVGISGAATTPDALTGISNSLGRGMLVFALLFGVLTMITSFLGVAESVREMLWWDYKFNKRVAWACAVFVPYLLYLIGFKNLIDVISFAGAVAGGLSAIILILIFRKLEKMSDKLILFKRKPGRAYTSVLIFIFICGIVYELFNFFA